MRTITILVLSLLIACCSPAGKAETHAGTETLYVPHPAVSKYDDISFSCGAGGESSPLVYRFAKLVRDKDHARLKAALYSTKPGETCLATICCEKLADERWLQLNAKERQQMEKNRSKADTVYSCSGCAFSSHYTLKQVFQDENVAVVMQAVWWLEELTGHPLPDGRSSGAGRQQQGL